MTRKTPLSINNAVRMVHRRVEGTGFDLLQGSSVSASSVRRGLLSIVVGSLKYFIGRTDTGRNVTGLDARHLQKIV